MRITVNNEHKTALKPYETGNNLCICLPGGTCRVPYPPLYMYPSTLPGTPTSLPPHPRGSRTAAQSQEAALAQKVTERTVTDVALTVAHVTVRPRCRMLLSILGAACYCPSSGVLYLLPSSGVLYLLPSSGCDSNCPSSECDSNCPSSGVYGPTTVLGWVWPYYRLRGVTSVLGVLHPSGTGPGAGVGSRN